MESNLFYIDISSSKYPSTQLLHRWTEDLLDLRKLMDEAFELQCTLRYSEASAQDLNVFFFLKHMWPTQPLVFKAFKFELLNS